MFEDKEEKLSLSYRDFSPSVISALLQGYPEKVKMFLDKINKKIDKPFEYRILMKELTSVDCVYLPGGCGDSVQRV